MVKVAAGAEPARPIEIVHLSAGDAPVSSSRRDAVDGRRQRLGRGSSRAIAAPADVAYQINVVTELHVGDGADVGWSGCRRRARPAVHLASLLRGSARDASSIISSSPPARPVALAGLRHRRRRASPRRLHGATCSRGKEHGDLALVSSTPSRRREPRALQERRRRAGAGRFPGQDRRRAAGAEDRRQDDDPGAAPLGRRPSSPRSRSSRSSPTTCSAVTARRPAGSTRPCFSTCSPAASRGPRRSGS